MTTSSDTSLKCIEIEATHPATHSVIWLHGLGADGSDFVSIIPSLRLPQPSTIRFIFPHAPVRPVTINQGYPTRAWYDIKGFDLQDRMDEPGIQASQAAIHRLIDREIERGIPSHHIILAGFSQGAAMALVSGFTYPQSLLGTIALSGYLPPISALETERSRANQYLPVFIGHGTTDTVVPIQLGEATKAILTRWDYQLTWKTYPIAHTVSEEEVEDIGLWLRERVRNS